MLAFVKQVVQNPMVTSFTSAVPALSSIQSVLGLVSNIAVTDKKVTVQEYINFNKEIEKYVDMSDDFDNMITIVLEHKQLDRMINLKLDSGDYNDLDKLVRNKKQLEKKYEDCVKK